MQFTFYGHSCFAIEVAGKKLLFDPFITGNPLAKDIDVNAIEADYILVSHGHGDHTGDLVQVAKRTGATIIGMYEVVEWAQKQGCEKVHGMNLGAYNFEFGEVRLVPAAHSSSMPDGSYGGIAAGIIVKTNGGNFYFAGDTCLTMDMQLVPRYGKLDFAIMPVGGNFTMNPEDAVIAAEFAQVNTVIGCHFDTFGYIKIDHAKAKELFKLAGRQLILPEIGETISLTEFPEMGTTHTRKTTHG
jgi:L-ascorbate metabolism protein UlaG (beta-lactamase superfamily)